MGTATASLETRIGRLASIYPLFEEGTIRTSAELMTERRTNYALRNQCFWTANFALYRVEDGEVVLYFGGREHNPIFNNIKEAIRQLIGNRDYRPSQMDVQAVIDSVETGQTLRVRLSDLELKPSNDEAYCFEIDSLNYDRILNDSQRRLAESIYGQGNGFVENMRMLAEAGKPKTWVYILNPAHVKGNEAIVMACRLNEFGYDSDFFAYCCNVENATIGLRGVLRKPANAAAKKIGHDLMVHTV